MNVIFHLFLTQSWKQYQGGGTTNLLEPLEHSVLEGHVILLIALAGDVFNWTRILRKKYMNCLFLISAGKNPVFPRVGHLCSYYFRRAYLRKTARAWGRHLIYYCFFQLNIVNILQLNAFFQLHSHVGWWKQKKFLELVLSKMWEKNKR